MCRFARCVARIPLNRLGSDSFSRRRRSEKPEVTAEAIHIIIVVIARTAPIESDQSSKIFCSVYFNVFSLFFFFLKQIPHDIGS